MKILFLIGTFNSKARYHPGIASLSAVLKAKEHKTSLLAVNSLDHNLIENSIKENLPDVIAVSTNSHQYHYMKEIIPFIKKRFKDIKIIMGGVHPTLDKDLLDKVEGLDAVCRGEGEEPLLKYVESVEAKRTDYDIPNISLKESSKTKKNRPSFYVKDLDSLPFPDYSIFPSYRDKKLNFPMRFLFNRGCPFNCTYCCNHKLKEFFPEKDNYVRYKSPRRVIDELSYFSGLYDFKHYVVDDDIFTLNRKWLLEFCNLYPESLKPKTFEVNVRVGTVDRDMLKGLKEIGCSLIKIGIESGSRALRSKILGRDISQERIIETADMVRSVGLKLHTFNMVGIPNETRLDAWKTVRLNRALLPDKTQLTVFYPYKDTALGEYCYDSNIVKRSHADSYFTETTLKTNPFLLSRFEIENMADFFRFFVYFAKDLKKSNRWFRRGVKAQLSRLKRFSRVRYGSI